MENQRRGGAAAEECGRIVATTFLSLLLPLSFLLLARLSSAAINDHEISSIFPGLNTALILSLLVLAVAIEALIRGLNGDKPAFILRGRRRLCGAWVLIVLMQVCLSLGVQAAAGAAMSGVAVAVGNLILARRAVFVLGMHEMTIFWRRSVVAPVVDATVGGFQREGFGWVEEVALAAGFGNLWWRRLRDEAEALVVPWPWPWPWLRADALGLLLYYLTAAIGGVRLLKALFWVSRRHCWREKKRLDAAVTFPV